MLRSQANTAQGRGGKKEEERGKKGARRCVCGWEGGERPGSPWCRGSTDTNDAGHAASPRREAAEPSPLGREQGNRLGCKRHGLLLEPCTCVRFILAEASGYAFLISLFFSFPGTRAALNKSLPITHSPARSHTGNTSKRSGAFSARLCKQPLLQLRGPCVCPPPPRPRRPQLSFWHAPLPPGIGILWL